jgi:hypothetical protein
MKPGELRRFFDDMGYETEEAGKTFLVVEVTDDYATILQDNAITKLQTSKPVGSTFSRYEWVLGYSEVISEAG